MKNLSILFYFALLFTACKKRAIFYKDATIISYDGRECNCCGGFFITIEERADTFLIDLDSVDIGFMQPNLDIRQANPDSLDQFYIDNAVLPLDVRIRYKIDNDCTSENRIQSTAMKGVID